MRYAAENLAVAERELAYEEPGFHTICFLCQSAAEKYLKGFLIGQGWKLERTRDVVVLLGLSADYDPSFSEILEDGAILNEYIVAGRYPGDLAYEGIGEREASEAIATVCKVRDWVMRSMIPLAQPVETQSEETDVADV